jgi:hypothetical protein
MGIFQSKESKIRNGLQEVGNMSVAISAINKQITASKLKLLNESVVSIIRNEKRPDKVTTLTLREFNTNYGIVAKGITKQRKLMENTRNLIANGLTMLQDVEHEQHKEFNNFLRQTLDNISMWEQLSLAAFMQKYWADNQVSATITFNPEIEGNQIVHALNYYQYQLKGISFLPRSPCLSSAYKQMPYEAITKEQYNEMVSKIKKNISLSTGNTKHDIDEMNMTYCDSDKCFRY